MSGDGKTQADAITFTGGNNVLVTKDFDEEGNAVQGQIEGGIGISGTLTISSRVNDSTREIGNVIHDADNGPGSIRVDDGLPLRLTGHSTYTGTTTSSESALIIDGSITSDTTVLLARLSGGGEINGDVTFNSSLLSADAVGGSYAGSIGTLTIDGDLMMLGFGSSLVENISSGSLFDTVVVGGQVDLADTNLSLIFAQDATTRRGDVITIIENEGDDAVHGGFSMVENNRLVAFDEGDTVSANGHTYAISYIGDDGNDVTLTDVTAAPPTPRVPPPMDDDLTGTNNADTVHLLAGNDVYDARGGNDVVYGDEGADTVEGGTGEDSLYGGTGTSSPGDAGDVLYGGLDDDAVYGNGGDDRLFGDEGADAVYGGMDDDTVYGGTGENDMGDAGDRLFGGFGADLIYGNGGADIIYGGNGLVDTGDGAERIYAGAGNDVVYGNSGEDRLFGGIGNDALYGGRDNDRLDGGAGNDTLVGGQGGDRFVFGLNEGRDTITDFDQDAGDRLDIGDQTYKVAAVQGGIALDLSGGGEVVLLGITTAEFQAEQSAFFA